MKRFATILGVLACAALLALCVSGCGKSTPKTVGELLDKGYTTHMTMIVDDAWRSIMSKDGSYLDVIGKLTQDQISALESLDILDDDYEAKLLEITGGITVRSAKDISSQIPSAKDLDKFVGKTVGDLEDAGWEYSGYWTFDKEGGVYITNHKFMLMANFDNSTGIENVDELDEAARRALVITKVTFDDFEMTYFDVA